METEVFDGVNRIGVLLPARLIPHEAKVTKMRGEKVLTLLHRIRVFLANGERKEITSDDDARFLYSGNGCFNAVSADTTLVWLTNAAELSEFLESVEVDTYEWKERSEPY